MSTNDFLEFGISTEKTRFRFGVIFKMLNGLVKPQMKAVYTLPMCGFCGTPAAELEFPEREAC